MAPNAKLNERPDPSKVRDPREGDGAEIIDLATRTVLPAVSQKKASDGFGLAAGLVIVAALGAVTLWSMDAARNADVNAPVPVEPAPQAAAPAARPATVPEVRPAAPLPAPAPSPVLNRDPQVATAPVGNPHASPTVIFDASALPSASPIITATPPVTGAGDANDDFAARIGGVGGAKAMAEATFDPATTISQGTLIPAVLETAIDTDVPGYVRAIVSSDIRSFDGTRILVPRSSRLIGQYKSGLSAGQKRAYVIWTRLIRPDGVSVKIGSPAIGFAGETGLSGDVDTHFFERFGSAMLLSVVGGLSTIAGSANVIIGGGGQSAAAAAINQSGQIGPTIRVRQGEPIRVFTAKDLDFSKVS